MKRFDSSGMTDFNKFIELVNANLMKVSIFSIRKVFIFNKFIDFVFLNPLILVGI